MKNTERFSSRVENYVKYRPHYPDSLIPFLKEAGVLRPDTVVADIGAGTGISAEPFLEQGNKVYAVEPNREMREQMIKMLTPYGNFEPITGTAERTTLPDNSVDLIVAGQAFHWFDAPAAKAEFLRIGKPGSYAALIWNVRQTENPFEKNYEDLLRKYGTDYATVNHKNITPAQMAAFFAPAGYELKQLTHAQQFDFKGLKGRLLSASYAPESGPQHEAMLNELEEIYDKFQVNGMVKFHFLTEIYLGPLQA
ncbi:Methyltransferase domain-containing protein [Chitinophaga jiangningensis]|uniref:Methyltransferase domain-containing protein n=1 Tax=Chitinophaga jiangningensis TaxID=1419482 RepID=A0A1M7M4M1_9BACT|nr:class I SAM-dependent methyltransferase [Chitinophaga jiangningensis]SHM85630.1 Methyltransferase domain-containing protein [Chitinophaga jiangningensis]